MGKLLVDFGGTHLKLENFEVGTDRKFTIFSSQEILERNQNSRFYRSDRLSELVVSSVSKQIESGGVKQIFIATQMSCGYDRGSVLTSNRVTSWQDEQASRAFSELTLQDQIESGNDIRVGSPILSVPHSNQLVGLKPVPLQLDSLGGFLADSLLGFKSKIRHVTDSFSLGGFQALSPDVKSRLGNQHQMPTVTRSLKSLGKSIRWPGVDVYTPVGDQQASLFGVELERKEVAINIGTGGQVAIRTLSPQNAILNGIQVRPYFENDWIATKTHLPAGRILSKYFHIWNSKFHDSFDAFMNLSGGGRDVSTTNENTKYINRYFASEGSISEVAHLMLDSKSQLPILLSKAYGAFYAARLLELTAVEFASKVVFAGGVGSKFLGLQDEVSRLTGLEIRSNQSLESTLDGILRLANSV